MDLWDICRAKYSKQSSITSSHARDATMLIAIFDDDDDGNSAAQEDPPTTTTTTLWRGYIA